MVGDALVMRVTVKADHWEEKPKWQGGGPVGALRAYQAHHPDAAIYDVTYRGRTVWMTSKQRAIWSECQRYWMRGKRDTLARIAGKCNCSRATVSRFLRRLDQWRFIDLITFRGRGGGVYVFTRPANEHPRIWTKAARFAARALLAMRYKHWKAMETLQPALDAYRRAHPLYTVTLPVMRGSFLQYAWTGDPAEVGNTSATLRDNYGARSRHA